MKGRRTHILIERTAKDMAEALYEIDMKNNRLYGRFRGKEGKRKYILALYPQLIDQARTTLAKLLATNISEVLKTEIYDALELDGQFRAMEKEAGYGRKH